VYANDYIVANFSGSPTTGSSGLLVTFTDLSMIGNRTNLIYNWTFGDGTYSSDSINVLHVYSSVGIYTVKLTVTNDYGTSTETKVNYIVISNQQTTTFYIPKTASFHVIDVYGNQIGGATLSATYNESTLPDTTTSWLVSNYGMNTITSGEATNGALSMSGITSDTGDLTFVMIAPLEYDMYITYGGVTNHFFITTGSSNYQLKFVAPTAADTSLSKCVYANGNTHTGISSPDPYNMTFMWSYQDTCGLTTSIDYIVNDVDLGTTVYNYHLTPVTSGIYVNDYTVSNVRGKNYIWYENATRSV
jgi:PKD repeat protein